MGVQNMFKTFLLQRHIQTQNDSGQPLWVPPKKYPQKMTKKAFFYKFQG